MLPEVTVGGVAAGLHVTVGLLDGYDEEAIRAEAHLRGVELETIGDYRPKDRPAPRGLLIGYGRIPEAAIPAGIDELAAAVRAARNG